MNLTIDSLGSTRKAIKITIPSADIVREENDVARDFARHVRLPGYRPGKAPETLVRRRFAKQIQEERDRKIVASAYEQAIKDSGVEILAVVDIAGADKINALQDAELCITVDIVPQFTLPEYKGIEVTTTSDSCTEEDMQKAIDELRSQRADYKVVERAAAKGDFVKVSYEGTLEGKAIAEILPDRPMYGKQAVTWEEAGAEESPGVQAVIQGIVGMKVGDKKTVQQDFPEDFVEKPLAGKKADYALEVLEVREKVLPEMDEAFLKSLKVESEAQLRERIQKDIEGQKRQANRSQIRQQVLEKLLSQVEMDLPESAVEEERQMLLSEHMQRLVARGVEPSAFEEHKQELFESAGKAASGQVKAELLLSRIAKAENIKIENADLQQRLMREAIVTRTRPEELVREIKKDRARLARLRRETLFHKTLDFLADSTKVVPQAAGGQ